MNSAGNLLPLFRTPVACRGTASFRYPVVKASFQEFDIFTAVDVKGPIGDRVRGGYYIGMAGITADSFFYMIVMLSGQGHWVCRIVMARTAVHGDI